MKKSAPKRKVNRNILGTVGAVFAGILTGAAAMFLSEKENRQTVSKAVNKTVKRGKAEVKRAEKAVLSAKKKMVRK